MIEIIKRLKNDIESNGSTCEYIDKLLVEMELEA